MHLLIALKREKANGMRYYSSHVDSIMNVLHRCPCSLTLQNMFLFNSRKGLTYFDGLVAFHVNFSHRAASYLDSKDGGREEKTATNGWTDGAVVHPDFVLVANHACEH